MEDIMHLQGDPFCFPFWQNIDLPLEEGNYSLVFGGFYLFREGNGDK
jgi:hypothetical protein